MNGNDRAFAPTGKDRSAVSAATKGARIGACLAAILIAAAAAAPALAQEKAAQESADADFEAALFAGSGEADSAGAADGTARETGNPAAASGNPAAAGDSALVKRKPSADGFAAAAASEETARVDYLVGGTVAAKASAVARGTESYTAGSDLRGKLLAKVSVPDYGSLFIAYTASYPFFQGYGGSGTAPPAEETAAPEYALSELHYSFDIGKKLFVRIGNQLIAWGPSFVWTPVDFINREKADAFADVDARVGKNGLRLHLPLPTGNLFFFADFSAMTDGGLYGDPAETVKFGGRADFTAGPFEFGLSGYGGANAQLRAGADFSGRLLGTTVYGEAAFVPAYGSYAQSIQAAVGFSRTLDELKRWTISAEGFINSRGRDLSGYTASTIYTLPTDERTPLYQGSFYAYLALATTELGTTSVSGTVSAIANLEDRSFTVKIAPTFTFPRAVPFTVALSYFGGGADKEFTRFVGDGAVGVTVSTKIAF